MTRETVTGSDTAGGYGLIGITSWGVGCGQAGNRGVYTEVSKFLDWVAGQFALTVEAS